MPSKRISVREGRQLSLLGGYAGRLNADDSTWNFANLITPNLNDTACGLTPYGLENGNSSDVSSTVTELSFMDSSDNTSASDISNMENGEEEDVCIGAEVCSGNRLVDIAELNRVLTSSVGCKHCARTTQKKQLMPLWNLLRLR
jgi:hypothetical protein